MGEKEKKKAKTASKTEDKNIILTVSSCASETISEIIKGNYSLQTTHHGKPVLKKESKEAKAKGLDVLIYYWDGRDGKEQNGWWFGPSVGSNQVWAFHPADPSSKELPPTSKWCIPHDGQVDPSFSLSISEPGAAAIKAAVAAAKPEDDAPKSKKEGKEKASKDKKQKKEDTAEEPPAKSS